MPDSPKPSCRGQLAAYVSLSRLTKHVRLGHHVLMVGLTYLLGEPTPWRYASLTRASSRGFDFGARAALCFPSRGGW